MCCERDDKRRTAKKREKARKNKKKFIIKLCLIDCSSFLPSATFEVLERMRSRFLSLTRCIIHVASIHTCTHSVRLGDSLSRSLPWQTAINLKRKISDTFAIMRNDGKLDNQTLHVLNVVFQICTTSCEWWEINKAFRFFAYLFNWKSRFFHFILFFSRFVCHFSFCHIWRHKKPRSDLANIWSCLGGR